MSGPPAPGSRAPKTGGLSRRGFITAGAAAAAPLFLVGARAAKRFELLGSQRRRYVKDIMFPVAGGASWTDTFGACRDGCRRHHEGQDLFNSKHQKLLACVSGTIVALHHGSDGNWLYIRSDADGWYYAYFHINNDTPGTDDGRNLYRYAFAPNVWQGVHVRRGQHIAYLGDSGNAEHTAPHLHFEIRKPATSLGASQAVNPKDSLRAAHQGTKPPGAPSGSPPLRRDDSGPAVSGLQLALNIGTRIALRVDGAFGPLTEQAVQNLQRWNDLTVDGVYGPQSAHALRLALVAHPGG